MIHQNHIGCDIGKFAIDIFHPDGSRLLRIDNSLAALTDFAASLSAECDFVVMEATGGYDRLLRHCLSAAGIAHARINPVMVRRFAQARGKLAKTDRLDARMLSEFGSMFRPKPSTPPLPNHEELVSLARRRDQLVDLRATEARHLSDAYSQIAIMDIKAGIADLDLRIAAIELELKKLVRADEALALTIKRLETAPGVGTLTAIAVMAHLPELGTLSPKAAASLAGLAPINRDSGKKSGKRSIRGGRPRLRKALYMAALAASRSKSRFNPFYQAIASRSGSRKSAIIAVARKLLTILNAMQRDAKAFQ
jgi:transposase